MRSFPVVPITFYGRHPHFSRGPGGSMSQVVALPNNSYKPITNTAWVQARLCKLQKGCTRLTDASDRVYQLLAHGRWFSTGTPTLSTTKTGRHDKDELLLKVALNTKNQNKKNRIFTITCPSLQPSTCLVANMYICRNNNTIRLDMPRQL